MTISRKLREKRKIVPPVIAERIESDSKPVPKPKPKKKAKKSK